MAGQPRRWAEAAAPPAARASGREGGAEARTAGSGRSAWGHRESGEEGGDPGGWEWNPESEPKAGIPNLAGERLAVLGTQWRDG